MLSTTLDELLTARREQSAVVLVRWLKGNREQLVRSPEEIAEGPLRNAVVLVRWLKGNREQLVRSPEEIAEGPLRNAVVDALRRDKSALVDIDGESVFVQVFNSALRMFVVGAVHIAQALVPFAQMTGYHVSVIDPRRAFAADERFPGVDIFAAWPDDVLPDMQLDARSALVTLTHDPKIDDPALRVGLTSDAFYIGSLGSRRTHAGRLDRLRDAGFDADSLARIHGPVGLDVGAVSPAEIAVAIMGQVTQSLRRRSSSDDT